MKSSTTLRVRQLFAELPAVVQARALKKVGKAWSARIDDNFRILAKVDGDTAYWFWIGPHAEYERLISQHRKG